jgi:hypothetical protein
MTKREFYRILKEKKIFGKFCAELAEAHSHRDTINPKERAENYVGICISMEASSYAFKTFITSVEHIWFPNKVKIQP